MREQSRALRCGEGRFVKVYQYVRTPLIGINLPLRISSELYQTSANNYSMRIKY